MYCSNLISAKIFTVHTKVKILPHLSPFSMFSWGTKLPAVSLLSVKYVFIIEASTASWLLIAILILQFWNDLDCWMAAVACWCSEEHLNINKVLLSLDLSFFSNTCTVNRGVSHYRILPVSRDIGWPVQQLDYFRYIKCRSHIVDLLWSSIYRLKF